MHLKTGTPDRCCCALAGLCGWIRTRIRVEGTRRGGRRSMGTAGATTPDDSCAMHEAARNPRLRGSEIRMCTPVLLAVLLVAANLAAASGPQPAAERELERRGGKPTGFEPLETPRTSRAEAQDVRALEQCSHELDECRILVRARIGDGGFDSAAMGGSMADFVPRAGSATGSIDANDLMEFTALTRAATDAANTSAADSIRNSPPGHLAAEYEKNGQVTVRNVWPRSVTQLAYQELEEVWRYYRLPATFQGTAFIRAEKDNDRIEGTMDFPPFDRLYSIEERSPALRRLITSSGRHD